jgi:uncharacterized protein YprB with RNaseH-like and TPR domain
MSAAPGAAAPGRSFAAARRALPGNLTVRASGSVHVAESRMPRAAVHGAVRLDASFAQRSKTAAVAARDPRFLSLDPERWGYFDTETTSLNAGAGVWVFLVGVGRFCGPEFVVRQFLLTGPGGEEAFLDAVREEFSDLEALVSFHGKSFDAPRLDDRCRLGAWTEICAGRPHWDLLHVVRRLYAARWPDGRLRTAEERLLEFIRTEDLPGQECPAEYFAYVRGRPHRLGDVFEHNRLDTVSLAALAGVLSATFADPGRDEFAALVAGVDWAAAGETDHAGRLLRLGVPALGQLTASMREKVFRSLRRCGEKQLVAALKAGGPELAIPEGRAHTMPAQRS